MKTTIYGRKADIRALEAWFFDASLNGWAKVENRLQHRAAEIMVAHGHAMVVEKKNYGRIAKIRITDNKEGQQS
jgi:hypothetical protein